MKIESFIRRIRKFPKAYYRLADFENIFEQDGITLQKSVERLIKVGLLRRLRKNVYVLADSQVDLKLVAGLSYRPSYLSFESVLYKHGVINQPPFEATFATTRRSKKLSLGKEVFIFSQIKSELWWGFERKDGMYEARLEKAVTDMLYLKSRGQRRFEIDEWYLKPINKKVLDKYLGLVGIKLSIGVGHD